MQDYVLLMHNDFTLDERVSDAAAWADYLGQLRKGGAYVDGSVMGQGMTYRKAGEPGTGLGQLAGYLRVRANSMEQAQNYLFGNPIFEAGGTGEIRELDPA